MNVKIYRDQPKPGESDAQWCGYKVSGTGHSDPQATVTNKLTPGDVAMALGGSESDRSYYNGLYGY